MNERTLSPELYKFSRIGGLLTRRRRPWVTYLVAFFLPVLIMLILWAIAGVQPFGSRMILAHDQWHQYYPFFLNFRYRILHGESLFFSWDTGMGTNFLSLYGYYLSSPLNWLALLVPDGLVLGYYTLTVLIKIGCAGLFFAIFLRHTFQRSEPVQAFFSTLYALCAFIMGYYWNAIWLDTVALLPLVALGTQQLLREKKFVLYVASLAMAVICSYYIGLFVCIFVFLLFVGYNFVNWDDFAGLRSRLWRIAFFTIIALGLTAVVTGPALVGLMRSSSADNQFPTRFAVNIAKEPTLLGVLDALRQIIANSAAMVKPTSMEGLPNIYCGVTTLVLAAVYCCCKHIPWREKVFSCFLLLFFALSFIIRWLDYVWHGFHFPNMLPYRFSFLYSFVLLFMAYRAWTQMDRFRGVYLLFAAPALLVFFLCTLSMGKLASIVATALLLAALCAALALYARRKITRNMLALALCCCMLLEAGSSATLGVKEVGTTDANNYPKQGADVQTLVDNMRLREAETTDLWRAEFTLRQSLNDPTLFSFPGVSVFSSACNGSVSAFLASIGLAASKAGNRYVYEQSDPAVNLLLGLKYLIDREGLFTDQTHFRQVAEANGALLLQNRDFVPVGWAVSPLALGYETETGVPFERIEALYSKLTGSDQSLYNQFFASSLSFEGGATGESIQQVNYTFRSDGEDASRMCIRFTKTGSGGVSLYTKSTDAGNLYLYVNDNYVCNYNDRYGQIRYFDNLNPGDVITLRYRAASPDKDAKVVVYCADFDQETYSNIWTQVAQQCLHVESRTDTEIEGTILCQKDSLFFTTIPYDKGWTATVDGEAVRITPFADAFVAFPLPAGAHEIRLSYQTPGLLVSFYVSLFALALFLVLVVLYLVLRLTRRPMAKIELPMQGMPDEDDGDSFLPADPEPEAPTQIPADVGKQADMPPAAVPTLPAQMPRLEDAPTTTLPETQDGGSDFDRLFEDQ